MFEIRFAVLSFIKIKSSPEDVFRITVNFLYNLNYNCNFVPIFYYNKYLNLLLIIKIQMSVTLKRQ